MRRLLAALAALAALTVGSAHAAGRKLMVGADDTPKSSLPAVKAAAKAARSGTLVTSCPG